MTTQTSIHDQGSTIGSLYMVLASLSFALMLVVSKELGVAFGMSAYEITFWRVAFAVLVLGGYSLMKGRDFRTQFPKEHFLRSLSGTIALLLNFYIVIHLPVATASTLNNTSALFIALLSVIILKQPPTKLTWAALSLGFVGVVLLLRPSADSDSLSYILLGLLSGLLSGYAYLQVRELGLLGEPAWRIVFYFALLGTLISGGLSLWHGFAPITPKTLLFITLLGVTALLGQLFLTYAYQVGRKFVVASLSYLTVAFSMVCGIVWFGERLDMLTVLGIGVIVVAGILSGKK